MSNQRKTSTATRSVTGRRRRGSVELEAVLITGVMFPLAVALYFLAIRGFSALYQLISGVMEWPFL